MTQIGNLERLRQIVDIKMSDGQMLLSIAINLTFGLRRERRAANERDGREKREGCNFSHFNLRKSNPSRHDQHNQYQHD